MKYLLVSVYQVCSNKSPWVKIGPAAGACIQVREFMAIVALLFLFYQALRIVEHAVLSIVLLQFLKVPNMGLIHIP
jgi:hypothetical protein